jgi:hypothetical protein
VYLIMNKHNPLFSARRLLGVVREIFQWPRRMPWRVGKAVERQTRSGKVEQVQKGHAGVLLFSLVVHLLILGALGSLVLESGSASTAGFQPTPLDLWEQVDNVVEAPETLQTSVEETVLEDEFLNEESIGMDAMKDGGGSYSLDLVALSSDGGSSGFQLLNPSPNALVAGNGLGTGTMGAEGAGGSGKGSGSGSGSGRGKKLFGLDVQSTNQGILVILDTSGSMEPLAAKARAVVERDFPDATVLTARGALFATEKTIAKMRKERGATDFYTGYYSDMLEYTVIAQVKKHLDQQATVPESIYFFSDFADFVDNAAVKEFTEYLTSRKIKFFAHSVGKEPDSAITRLCKNTGGQELLQKSEPGQDSGGE